MSAALNRLAGIPFLQGREDVNSSLLERRHTGFGYRVILFSGASANTNCTDYFSITLERDSTGKNHDLAIIGGVQTVKILAGLTMLCEILCRNIECARRVSFFDGDVYAA